MVKSFLENYLATRRQISRTNASDFNLNHSREVIGDFPRYERVVLNRMLVPAVQCIAKGLITFMILVDTNTVMFSTRWSFEIRLVRTGYFCPQSLQIAEGLINERNTMNNERKFNRVGSGVCWLITMCKDHGALRPSA